VLFIEEVVRITGNDARRDRALMFESISTVPGAAASKARKPSESISLRDLQLTRRPLISNP
jgi:hypothetical protein